MATIKRDNSHLSKPSNAGQPPSTTPVLIKSVAEKWFEIHMLNREPRPRAIEELPLRASDFAIRCDRQSWYVLTQTPETDPDTPASIWRLHLGTLVHADIDAAIAKLPRTATTGWATEVDVDLRPAGFDGSAHADAVHFTNGHPDIVAEFKSVAGFGFKMMATNFKGAAEGPKFEHCLQAAVVAVALNAPKFLVCYVALENVSPSLARSTGSDDYGRFTAEWEFDTDDWRPIVENEAKRQRRLLLAARVNARPARSIDQPDIPAGAFIDNPSRGAWLAVDNDGGITRSGTIWYCDYCRFKTQCIDDGANAVVPELDTF